MRDDLDAFRRDLAKHAGRLATALLGKPNTALSRPGEVRFGSKGSVAVVTAGPKAGQFFDHERGTGGDLLDLVRRQRGGSFADALAEAARLAGIDPPAAPGQRVNGHHVASAATPARTNGARQAAPDGHGEAIVDPPPLPALKGHRLVGAWLYHDAAGAVVAGVARYESDDGAKTYRPHHLVNGRWRMGKGPHPWPLYGAHKLAAHPDALVLVVEGQKAADAARERWGALRCGVVATTWQGGTGNAATEETRAALATLRGRHVVVVPDVDDAGAKAGDAIAKALLDVGAASVRRWRPDERFPTKWDVADDLPAGLDDDALLDELRRAPVVVDPMRRGSLREWTAARFKGAPPAINWLVEGAFPLGVPGLVAAMGDTGKSFMLLDLAMTVALGSPRNGPRFGGPVVAEGAAVIVTAEDDAAAIHRRLDALDLDARRFGPKGHRLVVMPLPDAGGPMVLFKEARDGFEVTDEWTRLCDELATIPDLRLVVLGPLQAFAAVPLNEDPAAGQFVGAHLGTLAARTGATVLASHHMRKGAKAPGTLAEARELIRGTSALVDGVRVAFALWPAEDGTARKVAKALSRPLVPNAVVQGGIVKANAPARREVRTYWRDRDTGLLVDVTLAAGGGGESRDELLAALVDAAAKAARDGRPFTKTGEAGVFRQRHRLPASLTNATRAKLEGLADEALQGGRLVACIGPGSTVPRFLDVPDGPFARGDGEVLRGAAA